MKRSIGYICKLNVEEGVETKIQETLWIKNFRVSWKNSNVMMNYLLEIDFVMRRYEP